MDERRRWGVAWLVNGGAWVYSAVGNMAGYWGWKEAGGLLGVAATYIMTALWMFASGFRWYDMRKQNGGAHKRVSGVFIGFHIVFIVILATQVNIWQIVTPVVVAEPLQQTADGAFSYRVELSNPFKWGQKVRLLLVTETGEQIIVPLRLSTTLSAYSAPDDRHRWSLLQPTAVPHVYALQLHIASVADQFTIDVERGTAEPILR